MGATTPIAERLAAFFRERLHIEVPSADTDLLTTGVIDSRAFVELLVFVEEEFGVRITLADVQIESFRTLTSIATFLLALLRARP